VADSCRVVLDRRYLIEEEEARVRQEIVDLLERLAAERPNFAYELSELFSVQPTMTDADTPLVRAVDAAVERVIGRSPRHVVSPGTYDQKHVYRFGQLEQCIAYGPGILDLAHQPDEWVGIDDMVTAAKVMATAALTLSGSAG
jgi:succinyl-diaminopimelate desuccinylase